MAQSLSMKLTIHALIMLTPNWSSPTDVRRMPRSTNCAELCDRQKPASQKLYLGALGVLPENPDVRSISMMVVG